MFRIQRAGAVSVDSPRTVGSEWFHPLAVYFADFMRCTEAIKNE